MPLSLVSLHKRKLLPHQHIRADDDLSGLLGESYSGSMTRSNKTSSAISSTPRTVFGVLRSLYSDELIAKFTSAAKRMLAAESKYRTNRGDRRAIRAKMSLNTARLRDEVISAGESFWTSMCRTLGKTVEKFSSLHYMLDRFPWLG